MTNPEIRDLKRYLVRLEKAAVFLFFGFILSMDTISISLYTYNGTYNEAYKVFLFTASWALSQVALIAAIMPYIPHLRTDQLEKIVRKKQNYITLAIVLYFFSFAIVSGV